MDPRHVLPRSRRAALWSGPSRWTTALALLGLTVVVLPHVLGHPTSSPALAADLLPRTPQLPPMTSLAATAPATATSTVEAANAVAAPTPTPAPAPTARARPARPSGAQVAAGPLFSGSSGNSHGCSAAVVDAGDVDLVLTAAHCVAGSGSGIRFAPGYHDGTAPFGFWTTVAAFADPDWISNQDPQRDYALLAIADRDGRALSDVLAGDTLGTAPRAGATVRVIGYPGGSGGSAVSCTAKVYLTSGYPSFDCAGFVGGTSGGPWTTAAPNGGVPVLRGVIGGLHQGGCEPDTSYTAAFDDAVLDLLSRAAAATLAGTGGDRLPSAGSDGC